MITAPCVIPDMDDATYHADPVEGGSLSSTGARRILDSPARYQWELTHRVEKVAFDVGHLVHSLVLGTGMVAVEIPVDVLASNGAASTKEAKAFIESVRAAGKVPMKADDLAPIRAMAEAVLAHGLARDILERPGAAEVSAFATDPETGVALRARFDYLEDETSAGYRSIVADLKTSRTANPLDFGRHAAEFGYDVQAAHYEHVLRLARGDDAIDFRFIVVETAAPHLVSVSELDSEFAAIGQQRMRRAIDLYKTCRESDQWPGYEPVVHYVEAPRWLAYQEGMVL